MTYAFSSRVPISLYGSMGIVGPYPDYFWGVVEEGASLGTSGSAAIDLDDALEALLQVEGTIDAVSAGAVVLPFSIGARLSVSATGTISADGIAISAQAGTTVQVTNEGRIVSRGDFGIDINNVMGSGVSNDGTIKAAFSAVRFEASTLYGVRENSGRIISTTAGYAAVDFASPLEGWKTPA